MGKVVGKVANTVLKPVQSLAGNLFGTPDTPDKTTDLLSPEGKAATNKLLSQYTSMLDQAPGMAEAETARLQKQVAQNVQDQTLRAQQAIAQRGLQNSSIGLRALMAPTAQAGNQMLDIAAGAPARQFANLSNIGSGIGNVLGIQSQNKLYTPGQKGDSGMGVMGTLLGAGIGASLAPAGGGAMGASIGSQLGGAFGNARGAR